MRTHLNSIVSIVKENGVYRIYDSYSLNMVEIYGSVYVFQSEVTEVLDEDEMIDPFAILKPTTRPFYKDGIATDLLLNIEWMDEIVISKNSLKLKKKKPQKTYLMRDFNTGYTKIGKSIDPQVRERTLQSQIPNIAIIAVCDENVEAELHRRFEIKRCRGEWFNLLEHDFEFIFSKYNFVKRKHIKKRNNGNT